MSTVKEQIEEFVQAHGVSHEPQHPGDDLGALEAFLGETPQGSELLPAFRRLTTPEPTGDERELMLSSIRAGMGYYAREDIPEDGLSEAEQIADFLADAGFRLVRRGAPVEPAVTDEAKKRAVEDLFKRYGASNGSHAWVEFQGDPHFIVNQVVAALTEGEKP